MNPDKTLFIAFVPPYYNTLVDNININIGSSYINVASSMTNIGVLLDRNTYKTLNGSDPEYLLNQLQDYDPTRALRSGDQNLLSVKKTFIKIVWRL